MRPSLFEYAGGESAFVDLAVAHHQRCLADPELNHPFSHPDQHPAHVQRLAAYWAEALGGPPTFSTTCSDQSAVLRMHAGNGDISDLGRRFTECFMLALDDARLPADPEFRAALRAYMEWSVEQMLAHPDSEPPVPAGLPMPRWSWDGLQTDPGTAGRT